MAQAPGSRLIGIAVAVICMAFSGALLWLAQRNIPIGTAYAVWTSIGAVGTFAIGIMFYGDVASIGRYIGIALIIAGVVTLNLASH